MSYEKIIIAAIAILILIMAAPAIASATAQIIKLSVNQGPYIVESAKTLCNINDIAINQLIDTVEKNIKDNDKARKIIEIYRTTGEITKCDVKQLVDMLNSDQKKKLNLPEIVCTTLNCATG